MSVNYWLMKSEPDVFSIDDLQRVKREPWDGVRNYQARNFMRDEMKKDDLILFYHSNAKPPGIAGVAKVSKESHPDHSQFDQKSEYFDPKSSPDAPRWFMVEVGFVEKFGEVLTLDALKADKALEEMLVVQKGQRLSVQPVKKAHFKHVLKQAGAKTKI